MRREIGQGWNPEEHQHLEHRLPNQFFAVEIVVQIKLYKENQIIGELKTELLWLTVTGRDGEGVSVGGLGEGTGGCKNGLEWARMHWVGGEAQQSAF